MTSAAIDLLDAPDRLNQPEPAWRREARLAAIDWLSINPMPTRRDESWRYTNIAPLMALLSSAVHPMDTVEVDSDQVDLLAGDHGGSRLVFVNGAFAAGPSQFQPQSGVSIARFSELPSNAPTGSLMDPNRLDGFVAFNWLAGDDGAFVRISADTEANEPIHIVHVAAPTSGADLITHPNLVVGMEPGARATVIESYVGFSGAALTNAETVIDIGDRADLTYHRVQSETATAAHVGHVRFRVGSDAHLRATSFSFGASTSRVAFDVSAQGDRSRIEVDGLYLPTGDENHDHVITVEHLGSHTTSDQRFKGVIDDRGRGSFTGQVIVAPGTIDTSASQTNHSLLLTRTAESDTRPWLEILADDVRCTHGATVGRLDDHALFYLRSRGIPEAEARSILIDGFLSDVLESVDPESLRQQLREQAAAKQGRPGVAA